MSDKTLSPEELLLQERAKHLLDREMPADYRREWTQRVASPLRTLAVGTLSVVIFRLGSEWLALPAAVFQEVAQPMPVHAIPHRRGGNLLGLVNVRGELLLCVALASALRAGLGAQVAASRTVYARLLVVNKAGKRLAFPVDEVFGVVRYHPHELREAPATLSQGDETYITKLLPWRGKNVGLIDDEALLDVLDGSFA